MVECEGIAKILAEQEEFASRRGTLVKFVRCRWILFPTLLLGHFGRMMSEKECWEKGKSTIDYSGLRIVER